MAQVKVWTIEELTAFLPKLDTSYTDAMRIASEAGMSSTEVGSLRHLLGYSKLNKERTSNDVRRKVVELYREHEDITTRDFFYKYCKPLGINCERTLYQILHDAGEDTNRGRQKWSEFKLRNIANLYENKHMTFIEIGKLLGIPRQTLYYQYSNWKKSRIEKINKEKKKCNA